MDEQDLLRLVRLVRKIILKWVYDPDSLDAVALKIAAKEEFGLFGAVFNARHLTVPEDQITIFRSAVRYMYERTQEEFEQMDRKLITLYRGVRTSELHSTGIQSWSTDRRVAQRFDGYDVFRAEVPSFQVLVHHASPLWNSAEIWQRESEYIVIRGIARD